MSIGEKIAAARKAKGWSQEDLGWKTNVSAQAVSKWESGKSEPTISQARKLAETYSIPLDTIIFLQKQSN